MKRINIFIYALILFAAVACGKAEEEKSGDDGTTEPAATETAAPEKEKVKINMDAENKELGVETEDVDLDVKGEDDNN